MDKQDLCYNPWLNHLRENIRKEKMFAKYGDDLIRRIKNLGYIVSYPEVFKEIYWSEDT